jgi:predicted nucleic acid-binding protein
VKIFLDSTFFIAYVIDTDENNELAYQLEKNGLFDNECYINNLIVNETVTVIGNKTNLDLAVDTYKAIKDNCTIINEYNIANFNDKVLNTYKKFEAKLSFADCGILESMKENNIKNIVSYYKSFDRVEGIERIFE